MDFTMDRVDIIILLLLKYFDINSFHSMESIKNKALK